jgi:hypothetical protein
MVWPTLASQDGESEAGRTGSEAKPFFISGTSLFEST